MKKVWVVVSGHLGKEEVLFFPTKKEAKEALRVCKKTNLFAHVEKTKVSDAKYNYMLRCRK